MSTDEQQQNIFHIMGMIFTDARSHLDKQFQHYDLSRNEWLILGMLHKSPDGLSQKFAKLYIGIEPSYFTKMLNTLEDKGFILREIDKNDRRNRIIKVNPRATRKINKIFATLTELNQTIQADLTKSQLTQLYQSLELIYSNLTHFIEK